MTTDTKIAVLETKLSDLEKMVLSDRQLLHRIIYSLLVLVAALAGKESLSTVLKGGTPWVEHLQFALTSYSFGLLTIYLLARCLTRDGSYWLVLLSGAFTLAAAFLRIDQGFSSVNSLSGMSYSVPFTIAGVLLLIQAIREWRK